MVERASQAPISNMIPIKANHRRVASDRRCSLPAWQFLYFLPLPQGHGSLRPGRLLTCPPLRRPQTNERERIDTGVEEPDPPMQMGARHTSRGTGEADPLAALHDLTDGHLDVRQMQIGRV